MGSIPIPDSLFERPAAAGFFLPAAHPASSFQCGGNWLRPHLGLAICLDAELVVGI